MIGSFAAELLKLRKHRATWALGALLALSMAVGHNLAYNTWQASVDSGTTGRAAVAAWWLRTENVAPLVVDTVAFLAGAIALILGALVGGGEYGWNTLKTILPRRAGRFGVLAGKGLGLGATFAAFVPALFVAGFVFSLFTSRAIDAPVRAPAAGELVGAMAATWLILLAWGAVGLALGLLSRGTTFAVGLGLVYALAIETLIRGVITGDNGVMAPVRDVLLGTNASALARAFVPVAIAGEPAALGPERAALTLIVYVVGALLVAGAVFRRRDIH